MCVHPLWGVRTYFVCEAQETDSGGSCNCSVASFYVNADT